jgi:hypothetical protein
MGEVIVYVYQYHNSRTSNQEDWILRRHPPILLISIISVHVHVPDLLTDPPDERGHARGKNDGAVKDGAKDVVLWEGRK